VSCTAGRRVCGPLLFAALFHWGGEILEILLASPTCRAVVWTKAEASAKAGSSCLENVLEVWHKLKVNFDGPQKRRADQVQAPPLWVPPPIARKDIEITGFFVSMKPLFWIFAALPAGGGKFTRSLKAATLTLTFALYLQRECQTRRIWGICFLACVINDLSLMTAERWLLIAENVKFKLQKWVKLCRFLEKEYIIHRRQAQDTDLFTARFARDAEYAEIRAGTQKRVYSQTRLPKSCTAGRLPPVKYITQLPQLNIPKSGIQPQ